jgi:MFS family permease
MENSTTKTKKGLFMGWRVVAGCVICYSTIAAFYWIVPMIFPQLEQEFGWTATDLGLFIAVESWLVILWAPIGGWICDRIGSRKTIMIFSTIALFAVLMYTQITEKWQVYLFFGVLCGLGVQVGSSIGVVSLPRKWFTKRAALASGLIGGGWGLFSALAFPAVSVLAVSIGWRPTVFIIAPIVYVMTILAAVFLIRDSPEKMGLNVDGAPNPTVADGVKKGQIFMTRGEALRTPQFWMLAVIYGVSLADLGTIQANTPIMAVDYGIPIAQAGTAMTALMIPAIFSRIGIGPLGDRFGRRKMLWIASGTCAVFLLAGWLRVNDAISLYVFLVFLGLVLMAGMTLIPPLWGDLFGRKYLASIMGLGFMVAITVSGLSTLVVGYIRTSTGSYNLSFLFLGVLFIIQVILLLFLRPTRIEKAERATQNIVTVTEPFRPKG